MTNRTTHTVVQFKSAFVLPGFDKPQPAGDYAVDNDEELIDAASRLVWRRTSTFIHLPAISAPASKQQMVPVDPADLDAALEHDRTTQ